MSSTLILSVIVGYFILLIIISYFTGKSDSNKSFFLGDRESPWYIVAFGMIGATLSGMTFISIPGSVGSLDKLTGQIPAFSYMQMTFGFLIGYIIIATVLIPLYYRLNLTSIYGYLKERYGNYSYKTGASWFLISRIMGASARLFIVSYILQEYVFDKLGIPFIVTILITILLIWIYTFRSGIKTIIWTDTLQTLFMLIAVGASIYFISNEMNWGISELSTKIHESKYSKIFFFEGFLEEKHHFVKDFLAGVFIALAMTGLDQDMMQKNLSCRNKNDAQKNIYWFSGTLVIINLIFLSLGALLYLYKEEMMSFTPLPDKFFAEIALNSDLGIGLGIVFILGLVAAAYSSADSALTSLTTSFCIDILDFNEEKDQEKQIKTRKWIHLMFSLILVLGILFIDSLDEPSVIYTLFKLAGYTYGPLLGLYAFGLITRWNVRDKLVPWLTIISPFITFLIVTNSERWFGYVFNQEHIILNGLITFVGLYFLKLNKRLIK